VILESLNDKKRIARTAVDTDELHDLLNKCQVVSAQKQCYTQAMIDMEILLVEMEDS
jgi:hypothetical protein